jgi:antitoxin (DNA-binding transcriptional repressor) of toxin-antitoxin stability system
MIMVNIADLKARLSEFIDAAAGGEHVVICKHNKPVAELRAIAAERTAPRDLTPLYPDWQIGPRAFDPLDDDEVAAWEGATASDLPHVAEIQPSYARKPPRKRR